MYALRPAGTGGFFIILGLYWIAFELSCPLKRNKSIMWFKICCPFFVWVNNIDVPYVIAPRRDGDIAACYADPSYAKEKLGWSAHKDINDMCKDAYNFVKRTKGL